MAEPKDMIVPMLREMREESAELRGEMKKRFDHVDARLEKIEGRQKNYQSAVTADTMMSRLVTGDFEERLATLEKQVDELLKGH